LIDLQNDFLAAPDLQPAAGAIVRGAADLLMTCREVGVPVIHVRTTTHRDRDDRMPHWKAAGRWICEAGTSGHASPDRLRAVEGEAVVEKQFFSGFGNPGLETALRERGCDTVVLAGVHLHGCVRATALDACQRGFGVWIAEDAVGSDDPIHGAISRRWLADRSFVFLDRDAMCAALKSYGYAWQSSGARPNARSATPAYTSVLKARRAWGSWEKQAFETRAKILRNLAGELSHEEEALARLITRDVGKPITMARAEVGRSAAILHAVAEYGRGPVEFASGPGAKFRHRPLGVVGVITPWNNPLAIPIGRIAPAIVFGNAVVWKPAPAGTTVARRLCELFSRAGWGVDDSDLVQLCEGDHFTACELAADPGIDGITLSGSLRAGYALQEIANRRHIPFQAEMGGNNGAIVWDDAEVHYAAAQIASAAFGFAGQRCTANRRAIVSERIYDRFVDELVRATGSLKWGDPADEAVVVGPLVSAAKAREVAALLDRAGDAGMEVRAPHRDQADYDRLMKNGAYFPPSIVPADEEHRGSEIVQEETFGPVLVVQRASGFDHALELLNGVRQGLVAALFSDSPEWRERFLSEARAGVLKFNAGTSDADASSPLGGWKASGVGPAEHGPCDREFFCRVQTIYDASGNERG
jgi:acyl-CoA reductase-like NAD-dependent aldehyde dehydrogenase/nicotinamidase-related amidase